MVVFRGTNRDKPQMLRVTSTCTIPRGCVEQQIFLSSQIISSPPPPPPPTYPPVGGDMGGGRHRLNKSKKSQNSGSISLQYLRHKICGSEAGCLDKILTKVFRVFLLVIHSHLYSFALIFQLLQTHATSYSFCKQKGEKPYKNLIKAIPLFCGLRNPYRKSENSQDYARKPQ